MILGVGSEESVRVPVIFLAKGTLVHPRFRGSILLNCYRFKEGYCVILNKESYMDDGTWKKAVKVVVPDIINTDVSSVSCVFPTVFSIYLTTNLHNSNGLYFISLTSGYYSNITDSSFT